MAVSKRKPGTGTVTPAGGQKYLTDPSPWQLMRRSTRGCAVQEIRKGSNWDWLVSFTNKVKSVEYRLMGTFPCVVNDDSTPELLCKIEMDAFPPDTARPGLTAVLGLDIDRADTLEAQFEVFCSHFDGDLTPDTITCSNCGGWCFTLHGSVTLTALCLLTLSTRFADPKQSAAVTCLYLAKC